MKAKSFFCDGDACDAYRHLRDDPSLSTWKLEFEEMWGRFAPYADPHFLEEAKTKFPQRTWEMYLTCALLDLGWRLDSASDGPDVVVAEPINAYVEAVAPEAGTGINQVPEIPDGASVGIPENRLRLRITGALIEKKRKLQKYAASGRIVDETPRVIAVNFGEVPYSLIEREPYPRIVKVVFGIGSRYVRFTVDDPTSRTSGYTRMDRLEKGDLAIDGAPFVGKDWADISAVIGSRTKPLNWPRRHGDDLVLVHNPNARAPIPRGIFPLGREFWVSEDGTVVSRDWRK